MFKIPIIYIVEDYEKKEEQTAFNWMTEDKIYQTIKNYNSSLYQEHNPLIEE